MNNNIQEKIKCRCKWCNLNNPKYIKYHDEEWGVPEYNDSVLFELLILESFQAGLSWECVLNKREYFREAFDDFEIEKNCEYKEDKVNELMENINIIRNRRKINATINNAKIFRLIQKEYGSFSDYIWGFTEKKIIYEYDKTSSQLSDKISDDLKKRGMKFVGTTIIYAYLQAIGIIYSHDEECFLRKEKKINL
ncbi:MAG: DNA-3-methyladenine glycosylase I [Lachnospiraceae bacterium]|jgi:DNA-3-methyladenine glycosylase I|nr:DNA-3-methyladenine glycosylase I [Lachnospiraceae bacterium]